jgi:hypothetical protein
VDTTVSGARTHTAAGAAGAAGRADDGRPVPNEPPPPYDEPPPLGEPVPPGGGGGTGRGAGRANGRPGGPGPGRPPGRAPSTAGPALEVLRHAVHDPAAVGQWLDEGLFDDPAHAGVYRALVESDTHAAALAAAPPPVADLLARLVVEEPVGDPLDAVRRLFTEVARRELQARRLASATSDDPNTALTEVAFLGTVINELRDPSSTTEVADRLLAWLRQRVGDGG